MKTPCALRPLPCPSSAGYCGESDVSVPRERCRRDPQQLWGFYFQMLPRLTAPRTPGVQRGRGIFAISTDRTRWREWRNRCVLTLCCHDDPFRTRTCPAATKLPRCELATPPASATRTPAARACGCFFRPRSTVGGNLTPFSRYYPSEETFLQESNPQYVVFRRCLITLGQIIQRYAKKSVLPQKLIQLLGLYSRRQEFEEFL